MSKARSLFLTLARDVSTDADDNMVSVLKIIDKFNSELDSELKNQEVIIPISYFFVSSWYFEKKFTKKTTVKVQMDIIDPKGTSFGGPEKKFEFPKGIQKININFRAGGLKVSGPGKYTLKSKLLDDSDKLLAKTEYPFEVEIQWHQEKRNEK